MANASPPVQPQPQPKAGPIYHTPQEVLQTYPRTMYNIARENGQMEDVLADKTINDHHLYHYARAHTVKPPDMEIEGNQTPLQQMPSQRRNRVEEATIYAQKVEGDMAEARRASHNVRAEGQPEQPAHPLPKPSPSPAQRPPILAATHPVNYRAGQMPPSMLQTSFLLPSSTSRPISHPNPMSASRPSSIAPWRIHTDPTHHYSHNIRPFSTGYGRRETEARQAGGLLVLSPIMMATLPLGGVVEIAINYPDDGKRPPRSQEDFRKGDIGRLSN